MNATSFPVFYTGGDGSDLEIHFTESEASVVFYAGSVPADEPDPLTYPGPAYVSLDTSTRAYHVILLVSYASTNSIDLAGSEIATVEWKHNPAPRRY